MWLMFVSPVTYYGTIIKLFLVIPHSRISVGYQLTRNMVVLKNHILYKIYLFINVYIKEY